MIEINGKVYRNMPEQVKENMDDIDALLKQLPYNGPYETLDDIPEDIIVDNGTYLVGTDSYTIYKYNENTDEFISLGLFGAKGDKGETGAKGETGDRGEQGIKGATGTAAGFGTPVTNVTTVTPVEPATCTITTSGDNTEKVFTFDFEIPQGFQGDKGDKGDKGDTGEKGEKGDTGDPVTITLDGVVYEAEDGNITLPDYPNTAIWGNVSGDIDDQSDLMAEFATKQDVISDLGSIRAGALDGASALQSNDVATVALTGSYNDLTNKPNIPLDVTVVTLSGASGTLSAANLNIVKTNPGKIAFINGTNYLEYCATGATNARYGMTYQGTNTVSICTLLINKTTGVWSYAVTANNIFSGSYTDLTNKPTIGDATITIQKNGQAVDTFTVNATANKSINITVPTTATSTTTLTPTTQTLVFTKADLSQESVNLITAVTASTTTTLS